MPQYSRTPKNYDNFSLQRSNEDLQKNVGPIYKTTTVFAVPYDIKAITIDNTKINGGAIGFPSEFKNVMPRFQYSSVIDPNDTLSIGAPFDTFFTDVFAASYDSSYPPTFERDSSSSESNSDSSSSSSTEFEQTSESDDSSSSRSTDSESSSSP